jgi:hypothetical protein
MLRPSAQALLIIGYSYESIASSLGSKIYNNSLIQETIDLSLNNIKHLSGNNRSRT